MAAATTTATAARRAWLRRALPLLPLACADTAMLVRLVAGAGAAGVAGGAGAAGAAAGAGAADVAGTAGAAPASSAALATDPPGGVADRRLAIPRPPTGGPADSAPPTGRVVASFSILADLVRELAPPSIEVTALVGPDADAHVFEPTPQAARRIARADLVVVNGLGFEGGWIERLLTLSRYAGPRVVASADVTPRSTGHGPDPHAWQHPDHAARYVARIAAALAARWPAAAPAVAVRRDDYLVRLRALHARNLAAFTPIPRRERRVVTSHDAFGYFGEAYGIDFLAPQGWSTDSEPSAAAVARLIRQLREQRVRAVFVENISNPRLVQRIADEAGARVGGRLYSDALSGPDGPAPSYLRMTAHNADRIVRALSG